MYGYISGDAMYVRSRSRRSRQIAGRSFPKCLDGFTLPDRSHLVKAGCVEIKLLPQLNLAKKLVLVNTPTNRP